MQDVAEVLLRRLDLTCGSMRSWWQREQCFSSASKMALATGSVGHLDVARERRRFHVGGRCRGATTRGSPNWLLRSEVEVLFGGERAIHKRLLLVPGGVEDVVDDAAEHLVHIYAPPSVRCRANAVANGLSAPSPSAAIVPSFAE